MKVLTLVVRPIRVEAVLEALAELGLADSCTVIEAKGYSRQKGYLNRYVGSEYSMAFLPKVEIHLSIADDRYDEVAERITRLARTGRMGDGKIFVLPLAYPEAIDF